MTEDSKQPLDSDDDQMPPRLRDAFAGLNEPAVRIPPELDARILSHAKADYARRMRFRSGIRWVATIGAAAASVAIAFIVHGTLVHHPAPLARGDINGDGKIDMLDAYVLAKRVAASEKLDSSWDVNGDGKVDQSDVDWIANTAVSITPSAGTRGGTQ